MYEWMNEWMNIGVIKEGMMEGEEVSKPKFRRKNERTEVFFNCNRSPTNLNSTFHHWVRNVNLEILGILL